jgi:DNA-binding beta-propeller fold protein YncE
VGLVLASGLGCLFGPSFLDAQGPLPGYRMVENWPQYPKDAQFEMGTGIAVDPRGTVYAISRDVDHWAAHPLALTRYRGKGTIWMFNREGKFLGKFAEKEQFIGPHSMYVDREGFFWVVDRDGHQVKKLRADGTLLMTLGEYGKAGSDAAHFNGPTGVAFLPNGDFVVSDGYWNSRLMWFSKEGTFLKQVGKYGNGAGEMSVVHAVALDSRGRLLVANVCGGALHPYVTAPGQIAPERLKPLPGCKSRYDIFNQDGSYVGPWAIVGGNLPLSIAAVGDRIYAGTTGEEKGRQDLVIVDARTDTIVGMIRSADVYVHQMALDERTGDIYVASVYPEHGGEKRGSEGPSFRRFTPAK